MVLMQLFRIVNILPYYLYLLIFREYIYKIIKGLWNIRSEIYGMNLPDECRISVLE